jgi:hypothetical protein
MPLKDGIEKKVATIFTAAFTRESMRVQISHIGFWIISFLLRYQKGDRLLVISFFYVNSEGQANTQACILLAIE